MVKGPRWAPFVKIGGWGLGICGITNIVSDSGTEKMNAGWSKSELSSLFHSRHVIFESHSGAPLSIHRSFQLGC